MIKDSALVSIITVQELLWRAQHDRPAELPHARDAAHRRAVYWALTIVLSLFQERLEKRLRESDVRM